MIGIINRRLFRPFGHANLAIDVELNKITKSSFIESIAKLVALKVGFRTWVMM